MIRVSLYHSATQRTSPSSNALPAFDACSASIVNANEALVLLALIRFIRQFGSNIMGKVAPSVTLTRAGNAITGVTRVHVHPLEYCLLHLSAPPPVPRIIKLIRAARVAVIYGASTRSNVIDTWSNCIAPTTRHRHAAKRGARLHRW